MSSSIGKSEAKWAFETPQEIVGPASQKMFITEPNSSKGFSLFYKCNTCFKFIHEKFASRHAAIHNEYRELNESRNIQKQNQNQPDYRNQTDDESMASREQLNQPNQIEFTNNDNDNDNGQQPETQEEEEQEQEIVSVSDPEPAQNFSNENMDSENVSLDKVEEISFVCLNCCRAFPKSVSSETHEASCEGLKDDDE